MGPGLTPERSGVIGAAQAQPNEPASKSVVAYRIIRTPSSFGHSHYHVRPAFRGLIGLCRNVLKIPHEGKNSLGGRDFDGALNCPRHILRFDSGGLR